jgi:transmembrane sensor
VVSGGQRRDAANAEAAAWIARVQREGAKRVEGGLRGWIDADPAHADAFERATDVWAMIPGAAAHLTTADAEPAHRAEPVVASPARRKELRIAAVAAVAALVVVGTMLWSGSDAVDYATAVGEQRVATLTDGSRIALNTDSRLEVDFDGENRDVRLDRGEAMFEVAHDASRPFIVRAGAKQVRAVGTSFIVRREGDDVRVTLIEGRVLVSDSGSPASRAAAAGAVRLAPGDRLEVRGSNRPVIAPESIAAATAWRRGQVEFHGTSLAQAAAELNRYGGARLVVDPRVATRPVSGVFSTSDGPAFANAAALLHNLRVMKHDEAIAILPQ